MLMSCICIKYTLRVSDAMIFFSPLIFHSRCCGTAQSVTESQSDTGGYIKPIFINGERVFLNLVQI